jgi:diguanylate cyclase (GGDEF)-like protein
MSGAAFLMAINFAIASLLAAAFIAIALYDRTRIAAKYFAGAYVLGAAYFGVEFLIPMLTGGNRTVLVGYALFLGALVVFNRGLARLYRVQMPWKAIAAIFVVSILAKVASDQLPRESFTRLVIYQLPYFVMQAIGAGIIFLSARRRPLDLVLAALLTATSVHYIMKPAVALQTGGVGASPSHYVSTLYAFIGQTTGAVLSVAVALLLMVILVRDLLAEITIRSETDALSGLFNRRGFELRFARLMQETETKGLPISLVLCDLDHFKSVNDTHGHAGGDRVIAAFADALREATMPGHVVARIGGEEFAIVLPGCKLAAARLFAESVRIRMGTMSVEAMPADARFTASFGVAERAAGETAESVHYRSDAALYRAKDAGRDRVRASSADGTRSGLMIGDPSPDERPAARSM